MSDIKCANFQGPHIANDKNECLFCNYNIEINLARSKLKCDLNNAEHIVKSRFKKEYPDLSNQQVIAKEKLDPNATLGISYISFRNPYFMDSFASTSAPETNNPSVLNSTADIVNKDVDVDVDVVFYYTKLLYKV